MDTAISGGDFLLDGRGRPVVISGMQEILQRVLIRLCVKKGSFIYDKALGSNLYTLKSSTRNVKDKALSLVREALCDMTEVIVDDVTVQLTDGERLEMNVQLSSGEKKGEVEITL